MNKIKGVIVLLVAIAYVVMPYDFDKAFTFKAIGYVDDFFFFMSAFMLFNLWMHKRVGAGIKRMMTLLSMVFAMLGGLSLAALALLS